MRIFYFVWVLFLGGNSFSQSLVKPAISLDPKNINYCSARMEADSLVIENALISRSFAWNGGNLATKRIENKQARKTWTVVAIKPDMSFPGQGEKASEGNFAQTVKPATSITPEHLEITVSHNLGRLQVRRVFRLYPAVAAIACDIYLRGTAEKSWRANRENAGDLKNIEELSTTVSATNTPIMEKLDLPGRHWKLDLVEFFDVTDRFNNLTREQSAISYRGNSYRGNLMFATDQVSQTGIFMLKEAPTSSVQLAYPGGDFLANYGNLQVIGIGMDNTDLDPTEWRRAYGFVTGVFNDGDTKLQALRTYQVQKRIHLPVRDEMILMNTWGDRAQDKKVNEAFCLAELEAGAKLGITHFQLDDGWQSGKSGNSAFAGGSFEDIWKNPDYWKPDKTKFPRGLQPLVEKGKELGIRICLWFNPSAKNNNGDWEKDADAIINMYRLYGIKTFKIDGVKMPDKLSEINFRKMLDKVTTATNAEVVFNLDVTAGRRGGYNYFNEYGNMFLENRYTDWQNYYPYWTLRNLWMLSKYIPPQNLQIEFLNKWRNTDKYPKDSFAPANYSFGYLFAITMAAQPLAWFEGTGLPAEAFAVAPLIQSYKKVMTDFHKGDIFPIGAEPSGTSWTGFLSTKQNKKEGYVLIYREQNQSASTVMKLPGIIAGNYRFELIAGTGKSFNASLDKTLETVFKINQQDAFALYRITAR